MSLFANPVTHAAHPPETWVVEKVSDRNWAVKAWPDGPVMDTASTRKGAEAFKAEGWLVRLYEKEHRWYRGETVDGWVPYAPDCTHCGATLSFEPNVGLVDAVSGDDGGTYDHCPHNPAGHAA